MLLPRLYINLTVFPGTLKLPGKANRIEVEFLQFANCQEYESSIPYPAATAAASTEWEEGVGDSSDVVAV